MIILKLHNFGLFHGEHEIRLDRINLFSGQNKDSALGSSNGSGKSTIGKNVLLFLLYGEVFGHNLTELISFGEKSASVEGEIGVIKIKREVPSKLTIWENGVEIQRNTNQLKQLWLNEKFGSYDTFKKFRLCDLSGINLLSLGPIALKQQLMLFIDEQFTQIRNSLKAKKSERELMNKDKRLYKFYLSQKRLDILNKGLVQLKETEEEIKKNWRNQNDTVNSLKSDIQTREKSIYFKTKDLGELNKGYCPILRTKCQTIVDKAKQANLNVQDEVQKLESEIKAIKITLSEEEDYLRHYIDLQQKNGSKQAKIKEFIMKLSEAFKFEKYQYTAKDVMLYEEAIKVLDSFSSYYISTWLKQLELIINDLLLAVNLKIEFTDTKDFIKVYDNGKEMSYSLLSSGQQTFLGAIVKLAILLQKGETTGLIIADDGMNSMDEINFKKFVEVCRGLDFIFNIIYQDPPTLEDINLVKIIREKGVSKAI